MLPLVLIFCAVVIISIPNQEIYKQIFKKDENIGYIWHISDFHIDRFYLEGGDPDKENEACDPGFMGCCRHTSKNQTHFAPHFGFMDNGECDIPEVTLINTLKFIANSTETPSAILYTGDQVDHSGVGGIQNIMYYFARVHELMWEYFTKTDKVRVFSTIGNHDNYPYSQMDFRPLGGWYLDVVELFWSPWFEKGSQEIKDIKDYAMFSTEIEKGFRLINLNTQWVDVNNKQPEKHPDMKDFMYNWLKVELEKAKKNGEKVWIQGHIVPGYTSQNDELWVTQYWTKQFLDLTREYSDIILAQLYGHEHYDRFTVLKDENENPINVAYLVPAIGPPPCVTNPGIRLIQYDKTTFEIVDFITIYNDIRKSNKEGKMDDNWEILYSAKDLYKLPDFSPKSWNSVLEQIQTDEDLYDKFVYNYNVAFYEDNTCTGNWCKSHLICGMKEVIKDKFENCIKNF